MSFNKSPRNDTNETNIDNLIDCGTIDMNQCNIRDSPNIENVTETVNTNETININMDSGAFGSVNVKTISGKIKMDNHETFMQSKIKGQSDSTIKEQSITEKPSKDNEMHHQLCKEDYDKPKLELSNDNRDVSADSESDSSDSDEFVDLNPTDITQDEMYWIHARNNKYPRNTYDSKKVGKWMLFPSRYHVNRIWNRIKQAIKDKNLYHAKVSTTDPSNAKHAIMIYTKDYTDIPDVIAVLDYLEISGIKPPNMVIKYKTDEQTRAGIYRGGRERPWIYSSDTIRC